MLTALINFSSAFTVICVDSFISAAVTVFAMPVFPPLQRQVLAVDAGFLVVPDRHEQALSALDDAGADGGRPFFRHAQFDVDAASRYPRHIVLVFLIGACRVLRKLLLKHRDLLFERRRVLADRALLDQTAVQHILRRGRLLAEGVGVGLADLLSTGTTGD